LVLEASHLECTLHHVLVVVTARKAVLIYREHSVLFQLQGLISLPLEKLAKVIALEHLFCPLL